MSAFSGPRLRVGVGREDITPALGSALFGYATPGRNATSVRDGLNVTALALEYGETRLILMTFDLCLSDDKGIEDIRRAVSQKTGVPHDCIVISYSHTHSGPITQTMWGWGERDEIYLSAMIPKAVIAVESALSVMCSASIGIGVISSETGVNRRRIQADSSVVLGCNPWGPFDPCMTVLRIEGPNGPIASLVHYGAHATVLGSDSTVISRDWPGVMVDRMEHFTGAPVVFLVGALGDVAPRCNTLGATGDGEAALQEVGSRAATDALAAWRSIRELRSLDLDVLTAPLELPYRPLPDLKSASLEFARYEKEARATGAAQMEYRHWKAVLEELRGTPRDRLILEQTLVRLGPIVIVPFSGETFSEIVLRLRDASPFPYTLCASVTNGSHGYFVTREARVRGGYEVQVERAYGAYCFVDNVDDILVSENDKLLRLLANRQRNDG